MTKRKTTATGLAKTSGQGGKLPGALPAGYTKLLADLKARVRAAQLRAVVSVNRELILLYWDIGRIIVEAQKTKGYGKQVVERLAEDLQKEFPGMAGLSPLNVWRMRAFYSAYRNQAEILSQAVTESSPQKLSQPVAESAIVPPEPMASFRGDIISCCWTKSNPTLASLVCPQGHRTWLVTRGAHAPH